MGQGNDSLTGQGTDGPGTEPQEQPSFFIRFLETVLRLLRFFSRLPVPMLAFERNPHGLPEPALAPAGMAVAGLIIALPAGLLLLLSSSTGLHPPIAAGLALAALALASGGLHEDGLADLADGLSGGRDKEHVLAIMRDSRIGAHGALALIVAFVLQWAALSAILAFYGHVAAAVSLCVAAVLSRILALAPLSLLLPARVDGRGASFGKPSLLALVVGLIVAIDLALVAALLTNLTLAGAGIGLLLALVATRMTISIAEKRIGGQTGDVCGAVQQITMVLILVGFSQF
jgi:adenosylcobinamide-GDP ribazoletransferase